MDFHSTRFAVFIFFLIISIAVQIYGEFIVIRHPKVENSVSRNLTCISEDDDSALIWNYNGRNTVVDFQPKTLSSINYSKCAIWNLRECLAEWKSQTNEWHTIESSFGPMGPVFDFRWEDFEEITSRTPINNQPYHYVGKFKDSSGSAVFSIRGNKDAHILLCEDKIPMNGPCIWIIIGGWGGKTSAMRLCAEGAPKDKRAPSQGKCTYLFKSEVKDGNQKDIEEFEWRTFTLKWIEDKKTIQVLKNFDYGDKPFLTGRLDNNWHSMSHISVRHDVSTRIKFHSYKYFFTENNGALISTERFYLKNESICVKLLVGLCPKCRLDVYLVNQNEYSIHMGSILGNHSDTFNELISWRSIKLQQRLQHFNLRYWQLEVRASLMKSDAKSSQWAIDKFRICSPDGWVFECYPDATRQSTILSRGYMVRNNENWYEAKCQKLSYRKSFLIDANPLSTKEVMSNNKNQFQKYFNDLIQSCGPSCFNLGQNSSLCSPKGCTCDRGFYGYDCSRECDDGYYGYDCQGECGKCSNKFCNKKTGFCVATFINEKPEITNITDTTATIIQKIDFGSDTRISTYVIIQDNGHKYLIDLKASGIPLTYVAHLSNLTIDTIHTVYSEVWVNRDEDRVQMRSLEANFSTTCYGNPRFHVTPAEKSLHFNIEDEIKICKFGERPIYLVRLSDPVMNWTQRIHQNATFPSTFEGLTSDTEYNVTISNSKTGVLLFTNIFRTLESAPPEVHNLIVKSVNETEVKLQWDFLHEKNKVANNFNVVIKLDELVGCSELNVTSPRWNMTSQTSDTTALITGLHPYAKYTVTVTANTTKPSSPKIVEFQTKAASIPTSKITKLILEKNDTLIRWSAPEDCTTISGPREAVRLFISNWNGSIWNFMEPKQTSYYSYDLSKLKLIPYTYYRVRVHVIRRIDCSENITSYQELKWRTQPDVPSAVQNLEIYDADSQTNNISLRWKPPNPPNGEIKSYELSVYGARKLVSNVSLPPLEKEPSCKLWEDYVCFRNLHIQPHDMENNLTIEIYAENEGVTTHGPSKKVSLTSEIYNKAPSGPERLTIISQGYGIVTLTWVHPMITATIITRFHIEIRVIKSDLQIYPTENFPMTIEHRVEKNQKNYSIELHLFTSTDYSVSIFSANERNFNSTQSKAEFSVAGSVAFESEKKFEVTQSGTFIRLEIPKVINATSKTMVSIIIKEHVKYEQNQSEISSSLVATNDWKALEYEVSQIHHSARNFSRAIFPCDQSTLEFPLFQEDASKSEYLWIQIGDSGNDATNCTLHFEGTYTIVATVQDFHSNSTVNLTSSPITLIKYDENLKFLIIFPIVACLLLLFYIYRKCNNFTKSKNENVDINTSMTCLNQLKPTTPPLSESKNSPISNRQIAQVVPYNPHSCTVKIDEFEKYTKDGVASGLLTSQYEIFTRGLTEPCEYGKLAENKSKNRYKNLIAYDETRVVLQKIPEEPYSDYINASYIQGFGKKNGYIATQGPTKNTIKDFWRMVWQEEVTVICMLANVIEGGRTKCEQYWPDVKMKLKYGEIKVWNKKQEVFVDYTIRTFIVTFGNEKRQVTHLHYTGWPDHGVPMQIQSLISYLKRLREIETGNGPVVVHCSAGVGRTGTIILCDTCLRSAEEKKVVDLLGVTTKMRQRRANMVGNMQQYLFAHILIIEYTNSDQTQIPCDNNLQHKIKELRKRLPHDITRLNNVVWQDQALYSLGEPGCNIPDESSTNNTSELVPVTLDLAHSEASAILNVQSKYNTTIGVDGMRMKNQYLVSRFPSTANQSDFWRIISEECVELIIILQRPDPNDSSCCEIIPRVQEIETNPDSNEEEQFTIDELLLPKTEKKGTESHPVTVLTCNGWEFGKDKKLPPASTLVSLWMTSEKISRQKTPTFVICQDGVTGCGLYIALSFLLERMAVERICDVISAVRAMRRSKPGFVRSLEQFEYLYDAAVKYDECFQTYANFT